MEAKEYEVEVIYRQRAIYRIAAPDPEAAERQAAQRWQRGDESDAPGYQWSELEAVEASEAPAPDEQRQDEQVVLRFLRERERLIQQLSPDLFNPQMNDAISADQIASDLGWVRRERNGKTTADAARATRVLEQLCRAQRVICFQRSRVRAGERGEVRLYCTPEYLNRLTSALDEVQPEAV